MATALREIFAEFTTRFNDEELERGERTTSALTGTLRRFAGFLVARFTVNAIRGFITDTAAMGDELDKTSQSLGISSRALQEWRLAAGFSGVGAEELNAALLTLQRGLADAAVGSGEGLAAFRRLGIQTRDTEGEMRDVESVLFDIADGLETVENPTERNRILMGLLGESGARLAPLFAQGTEGIRAMQEQLEELGGGLSEEAIAASANLTDAMAEFDQVLLSIRSRIATSFLPVVERLVDGLSFLLSRTQLLQVALGVGAGAGLIFQINRLRIAMIAMGREAVIAQARTFATFIAIGVAIAFAIALIEDFVVTAEGGDSVMSRLGNTVQNFINDLTESSGASRVFGEIWQGILDTVTAIQAVFADLTGLNEVLAESLGISSTVTARDVQIEERGLVAPGQGVTGDAALGEEGGVFGTLVDGRRTGSSLQEVVASPFRTIGRIFSGGSSIDEMGAGAGGQTTNTITQTNEITIQEATDARGVERIVERGIERANRQAMDETAFDEDGVAPLRAAVLGSV